MQEITMTFNAEITLVKKNPPECFELADRETLRKNAEEATKTFLGADDIQISNFKVFPVEVSE